MTAQKTCRSIFKGIDNNKKQHSDNATKLLFKGFLLIEDFCNILYKSVEQTVKKFVYD